MLPDCMEFDNNIKLLPRITSKLRSKWRWKAAIKTAVSVLVCNAVVAYDQGLLVCYKRNKTAYTAKTGKCGSIHILKAIDMLVEMGYIEDLRSNSDLPASKRKLSAYKLTIDGYNRFMGLGEKI